MGSAPPAPFADLTRWPEWGELAPHLARSDQGPELAALRKRATALSRDDIEHLIATWRGLEQREVITAWAQAFGSWNMGMNSHALILYDALSNEPGMRVTEAIETLLARAHALGLALPDPETVRCFAKGIAAISGAGRPVPATRFAGSLDGEPPSWAAALCAATALVGADEIAGHLAGRTCVGAVLGGVDR